MPDPRRIADMERAAERLSRAVLAGEAVALLADNDADGSSAAAILLRWLGALGCPVRAWTPNRFTDGYGPSERLMDEIAAAGCRLVVTLDCGTTAFAALAHAAGLGLEVIVCDHHTVEGRLPEAYAVLNPNRPDDASGLGGLAGAGVAFMLAVAGNRYLREEADRGDLPDLMPLTGLAALGTVCDVRPLTGLNRALVARGLSGLYAENPGLAALMDGLQLRERPRADSLAFRLGPCINAGARMGAGDLGRRLLASDDPSETRELAETLIRCKR